MSRMNRYGMGESGPQHIEGRTRDELIEEYIPKVRLIASMIASKLGGAVEFNELMNSGLVGLLDSIEKFDSSRSNKFTTYAEFRIRGAILDSLRGLDLLTRTAREKANNLKKTLAGLNKELGREPSIQEVAKALGMSLDGYFELLDEVKAISVCSLDTPPERGESSGRSLADTLADSRFLDPYTALSEQDFRDALKDCIRSMPERLRQIIVLYYFKELNFREIGEVIGLSESRISQLHSEAIIRLRNRAEKLLSAK